MEDIKEREKNINDKYLGVYRICEPYCHSDKALKSRKLIKFDGKFLYNFFCITKKDLKLLEIFQILKTDKIFLIMTVLHT